MDENSNGYLEPEEIKCFIQAINSLSVRKMAPMFDHIQDKIYKDGNKCFKYRAVATKCAINSKIIDYLDLFNSILSMNYLKLVNLCPGFLI